MKARYVSIVEVASDDVRSEPTVSYCWTADDESERCRTEGRDYAGEGRYPAASSSTGVASGCLPTTVTCTTSMLSARVMAAPPGKLRPSILPNPRGSR